MGQLNLSIKTDEKENYKFFCALNKSVDGKVLHSNVLKWDQIIKAGTRLVVQTHKEKGSPYSTKREWRYRLFLDESRAHSLPRSNASEVQKTKN